MLSKFETFLSFIDPNILSRFLQVFIKIKKFWGTSSVDLLKKFYKNTKNYLISLVGKTRWDHPPFLHSSLKVHKALKQITGWLRRAWRSLTKEIFWASVVNETRAHNIMWKARCVIKINSDLIMTVKHVNHRKSEW